MNLDALIAGLDKALRTICAAAPLRRPMPGGALPEAELSHAERRHVAALMRVNHCGEICAQALYQGQAMTSQDAHIKRALEQAGHEESEHLAWTARRLEELGGRQSLLKPLWYGGALAIGVVAGKCGDAWNLGFLAETERQVEAHLLGHEARLPIQDQRSRAILEQMRHDEVGHAQTAVSLGARELPAAVKWGMRLSARLMTATAYHL